MADVIKNIQKELKRVGCGRVTVSAVENRPDLCRVDNAERLSGLYEAERLLNTIYQLRSPDIGEDGCRDVFATLAQIGFEDQV